MSIVTDWSKYPHFKKSEFDCKCGCGYNVATDELLIKLEKARVLAGVPFVLSSGCRCQKHNDDDKDSVSDSEHVDGLAVDVFVSDGLSRYKVVTAMLASGFVRVGVAKSFVHGGVSTSKPQNVIWTY